MIVVIVELIKFKATLDIPDNQGDTALIQAARKGHKARGADTCRALGRIIRRMALRCVPRGGGDRAVRICITRVTTLRRVRFTCHMHFSQAIVDDLITASIVHVKKKAAHGRAKWGTVASLDAQNKDGVTALIAAAAHGQTKPAVALIKANAKLDIKDKNGDTALLHAARTGHVDLLRFLTQRGADANLPGSVGGKTALQEARGREDKAVVAFLEQAARKRTV